MNYNYLRIIFQFSNIDKLRQFQPKQPRGAGKQLRPFQHPSNQLTKQIDILEPKKSSRFLVGDSETSACLFTAADQDFKVNQLSDKVANAIVKKKATSESVAKEDQRFLSISLVGPPNSGKSTLMNLLVGEPVTAVSNKSNTTMDAINGIHTNIENGVQLELIDLPGIVSRYKFTKYITTKQWGKISDTNMAIVMVDAVKTLDINMKYAMERLNTITVDKREQIELQRFSNQGSEVNIGAELNEQPISKVLVLNKMDLCFNKRKLQTILAELEDLAKFDKVFYISSLTGYGVEELKQYLYEQSFSCQWKYKEQETTPDSAIDQIEQMVRQAIFKRFYWELPFLIGVQTKEFRVNSRESAKIVFQLNTQTENQARIVIGEQGRNVKQLINEIQIQLVKIYKREFIIKIQVSVKIGDKQQEFTEEKEDRKRHTLEGKPDPKEEERKQTLSNKFSQFINS